MLNEEWIFAFKYDILMNSVVVVLTLKCVNHFLNEVWLELSDCAVAWMSSEPQFISKHR